MLIRLTPNETVASMVNMTNTKTSNQALTADNITDEQITELLRLGEDNEAEAALRALRKPRRFFNGLGVGDEHMARQAEDQRKARAWCASILNVRIAERRCRDCGALCDHATWDGLNCPWCHNAPLTRGKTSKGSK